MLFCTSTTRRPTPVSVGGARFAVFGPGALCTVVAVGIAAFEPLAGLAFAGAVVTFALVVTRPVRGAYLYLFLTPLIAGFSRGAFVPLLRSSEALALLVMAAVVVRYLSDGLTGLTPAPIAHYRASLIGRTILGMAVFSSAVPLLWRAARGFRPLTDDFLYATTLWKYLAIFVLFRMVVVHEDQIRICVNIMLGVGVVVGAVAILQALGTPGVTQGLAWIHSEPLTAVANNRGSSTLGTSHGTADVMAFDLAISLSLWYRKVGPRWLTAGAACFFGLACFASGQISAVLALLIVAGTFGFLTARLGRTLAVAVPSTVVAAVVLWPVVQARINSTTTDGVPDSWEARYFNLSNYFWPELFRDGNWLFGVRPAGRLPSFEPWREWVFIESGHTWLLWTGGVPLTLAFLWFCWHSFRAAVTLSNSRPTARGPAGFAPAFGLAVAVSLSVVFVLMLFDVHLTLRGAADALFPMLAMVTAPVLWNSRSEWRRTVIGRPVIDWSRLIGAGGRPEMGRGAVA